MKEYIEREAAKRKFIAELDGGYCLTNSVQTTRIIDEIPAADVRENVHGEWIYGEFDIPHCSECGHEVKPNNISKFCPNCGAQMEEQKND